MKTAGTSIEMALSRHCGPNDVITPITPEDEAVRRRLGVFPQNYEFEPTDNRAGPIHTGQTTNTRFFNHMSAAEIRQEIGEGQWASYFKFCVERNPWEGAMSMYYWQNRREAEPQPLPEFLQSEWIPLLHQRGWELYTMNNEVAVDRILRYEAIETELESVRRRLGIPTALELPHAKAHHRMDRRPHYDLMTPGDMDLIARVFEKEIALMGYQ